MADAVSFENQLADLVEWLYLGVQIPIIVIIAAGVVFLVLFYLAASRRGTPKSLEIPGRDIYIELHGGNVSIKVNEPVEPAGEVEGGEVVPEERVEMAGEPAAPAPQEEEKPEKKGPDINNLRIVADINSAVSIIAKKHGLDSLTLANSEGLVIASSREDPDEDAAEAASVVAEKSPVGENPVETGTGGRVVQLAHRENAILVHMRGEKVVENLESILQDVKISLERTLA
ncbi:MAG: hypothetical protein GXO65_02325 [Euryarchaeota archaeon]|nr:hypothetical protein [Euryarchaeota archaeon]